MSKTAIKVEGLSKKYLIGHEKRESYTSLRDVISNNFKEIVDNVKKIFATDGSSHISGNDIEEFWALKDLNFEIKQGEVVGIIGRNGAGKSTLLKVLSRITEPSKGRLEINGRMASLLEVGTGFHPELSGRENIYLNGAILGMNRQEIKRKFDEIVDFSGVEKFLDTPVKRYSSGMYVRLAFSVAAHLDSEILIVDEVLAVGDAEFQKKCLGKMGDASRGEGRTVLFVSHDLDAIRTLCSTSILLEEGRVKSFDKTESIINTYRAISGTKFVIDDSSLKRRLNRCHASGSVSGNVIIKKILVTEESSELNGDNITLQISMFSKISLEQGNLGIHIGFQKSPNSPVEGGSDYFVHKSVPANSTIITELTISNMSSCSGDYLLPYIVLFDRNRQPYDVIDTLSVEVPSVKVYRTEHSGLVIKEKAQGSATPVIND